MKFWTVEVWWSIHGATDPGKGTPGPGVRFRLSIPLQISGGESVVRLIISYDNRLTFYPRGLGGNPSQPTLYEYCGRGSQVRNNHSY